MKHDVIRGEPMDKLTNSLLRETVRQRVYVCRIGRTGRAPSHYVTFKHWASGRWLYIHKPVWTL